MPTNTLCDKCWQIKWKRYILPSRCHFTMSLDCQGQNHLFHGDSQEWPMPDSVYDGFTRSINLVYSESTAQSTSFSMSHNPTNKGSIHSCDTYCWRYYPLQTCSTIRGVSIIMSMCLAATPSFLSLKGSSERVLSGFHYLQDISTYSDFCRFVVMRWLLNETIDISALRCTPSASEYGIEEPSASNIESVEAQIYKVLKR